MAASWLVIPIIDTDFRVCLCCSIIVHYSHTLLQVGFRFTGVVMAYRRKRSRNFGRLNWTAKDMEELAQAQVSAIVVRTFQRGQGPDGQKFKPYSTKPIYVSTKLARLKPKGGRPSRTGASVYYSGGYRHYKKDSRSGGVRSGRSPANGVDLVLSGEMMESFKVVRVRRLRAIIGLTGSAKIYGTYVNSARPWIGVAKKDRKYLRQQFKRIMRRKRQGGTV